MALECRCLGPFVWILVMVLAEGESTGAATQIVTPRSVSDVEKATLANADQSGHEKSHVPPAAGVNQRFNGTMPSASDSMTNLTESIVSQDIVVSSGVAAIDSLITVSDGVSGSSMSRMDSLLTLGDALLWHGDIFGVPKDRVPRSFVKNYATREWLILFASVIVLIAFDFTVLQRLTAWWAISSQAAAEAQADLQLAEVISRCCRKEGDSADGEALVREVTSKPELAELLGLPSARAEASMVELLQGRSELTLPELRQLTVQRSMAAFGRAERFAHFVMLCFWLGVGVAFNAIVWYDKGRDAGFEWCSGYFLEWLLSMDNLFVFHLIFRLYKTPRCLIHKALFVGILGAVVFRMMIFSAMRTMLHLVHWVRFIFGFLLIYSGIQTARSDDDDDEDLSDTMFMRFLKFCLGSRIVPRYDEQDHRIFVWEDKKLCATLLVPVIFCLEITDIMFAVDSVSAKVAQIPDYYIAYSSSVIAIFGLRAMFFIIQDLVDCFDMLKYGLCFILVFIGIELLASDYVQLPSQVVCAVIMSVFVVFLCASTVQSVAASRAA